MDNLVVSTSPHITKQGSGTRRIMLDVLIALIPVVVMATILFGYHVLINLVFCGAFCFVLEMLYTMIANNNFSKDGARKSSCWDCSCLVTGAILALNLPATINIWGLNITAGESVIISFDTILVCLIGSIVAIVLTKMLFGGIGKNFANPALTARVFLLLCFSANFLASQSIGLIFDASTGATWLSGIGKTEGDVLLRLFIGNTGAAAVGETSVVALLIGYIYLCVRKVIDWKMPAMIMGFSAIFALVFTVTQGITGMDILTNTLAHLISGGLLFGAIFMATDYSTTPNTFLGSCIFALGVALFTMLIRFFGSYPEGMSFAILIMNIITPLLDKYIYPKPMGYCKKKKEATK